jgi:hypothetical protein
MAISFVTFQADQTLCRKHVLPLLARSLLLNLFKGKAQEFDTFRVLSDDGAVCFGTDKYEAQI